MSTIRLTIDNKHIEVPKGTLLLDAAKTIGINIPTLCHFKLEDLNYENNPGSCRICVVEIDGRRNLAPACKTECTEGMVVLTHTPRVLNARRTVMELILSNHPADCLTCSRNGYCDLQKVAHDIGMAKVRYKGEQSHFAPDISPSIVRDMDKCIMCRRCETACNTIQTVGALSPVNRGFNAVVATAFGQEIAGSTCINCGQCVSVCPTGALAGRTNMDEVLKHLADPKKVVIAQTAPAVRTALGRDFGFEAGTLVTGKMISALRELGFDYVFDTDFAADLTIMEESTELLQRIGSYMKGDTSIQLPLMTSCCPGWVSFVEQHYPDMIPNLSTARSPQQMFGAVAKNYYAKKLGIPREDLIVVSIMPCLAKKYERQRDEFQTNGDYDVNYVLYTRELAKLVRYANINFKDLPEGSFDQPMGVSTGASVIFGTTGGVIEASLRTAYESFTNKTLEYIDFDELRGMKAIRMATIDFDGTPIKVAIAHGLGNARKLIEAVRRKEVSCHAIEVMACPGGCIGGGGQPYHRGDMQVLRARASALYREDRSKVIRKSHHNESVMNLYDEFLEKPCSDIAYELLHTHYKNRKKSFESVLNCQEDGK